MAGPAALAAEPATGEGALVDCWTYQVADAWQLLLSRTVLWGDRDISIPGLNAGFANFLPGYEAMAQVTHERTQAAGESDERVPPDAFVIWVWLVPPDYLQDEPSVLLHLRVPSTRLVRSRFAVWNELLGSIGTASVGAYSLETWLPVFADVDQLPAAELQGALQCVRLEDVVSARWVAHYAPAPRCAEQGARAERHVVDPPQAEPIDIASALAELCARREVFEQRLSLALPRALPTLVPTLRALAASLDGYLVARSGGDSAAYEAALALCGTPERSTYAGRVGTQARAVRAVLRGDEAGCGGGSGDAAVRALLCVFYVFITRVLSADLAADAVRACDWARAAGWDAAGLARLAARAPGDAQALAKLDWMAARRLQLAMRREQPCCAEDDAWSAQTRAEFAALGGELGAWEASAACGHPAAVPWQDASLLYSLVSNHALVACARAVGQPLRTGVSGVTLQLLVYGVLALPRPRTARVLRAACVCYLVGTRAHSFIEVCLAAHLAANEAGLEPLALPRSYVDVCGSSWETEAAVVRDLQADAPGLALLRALQYS